MNDRIKPDYSVPLTTSDGSEYLLDCRYDFIRVFPWLGYGIVNVLTEDGIHRLYTDEQQCHLVHESSGIPLVELEWITESENETIRQIIADDLDNIFKFDE
jgi:hypothetical protein